MKYVADIQTEADKNLQSKDLIPFTEIEKAVEFEDIQKHIVYGRVFTPGHESSGYSILHYKNWDDDNQVWTGWKTKSGLLSNMYTAIKTPYAMNAILENLQAEVEDKKEISENTYSYINFALKNLSTLELPDDKKDQLIFKLLTNISPDSINSNTKLLFTLVNSFGGEHRISLKFGLLSSFEVKNNAGQQHMLDLKNFILLDKFSVDLIHNNNLELKAVDITNVKDKINKRIREFKDLNVTEKHLELFEEKFTKKMYEAFLGFYNSIGDEYKNFYYISYILSYLCQDEKFSVVFKYARILNQLVKEKKENV